MTMIQHSLLAISACALMSAVPLTAASMRGNWPPEFLSGKIASVDPDHKLARISHGEVD